MGCNRRLRGAISGFVAATSGGSFVEFAIVVGLIVTPVLLGIFEFGYSVYSKNSVTSDAREGARYAIVRGSASTNIATLDSVRRYVRSRTSLDTLGTDSIRVYAVWPTNNTPGSTVEVSVARNVGRRGPFLRARTDSAKSVMVILY
ncbi:MAG TPA: TadE family protein [Gemmatimonadaceae bacterium]|nr:TadE family protein [Gemmatimonadaceae bacterium]